LARADKLRALPEDPEVKVPYCFPYGVFPSSMSRSLRPSMVPPETGMRVVASYDPLTETYKSYYPGVPSTDFLLKPGEALWIWCSASGTLTYFP